ncbi:hypothetical protein ACJ6WD_10945 [Streptomyces sp. VTCC 41912]|uniref:hypothetical protein n=1 Tax=Streptomyces TaxID=1883 RepID=UPI00344F7B83
MSGSKWVTDVAISQGESLHEVAQITVLHQVQRNSSPAGGWLLDAAGVETEGSAIALRFGDTARSTSFYGYVTSVAIKGADVHHSTAASVLVPVVYTCLGPTHHMQSQTNRLWTTATASYAARTIIRAAGLRPQVQQSSRRFENLPQQSVSDFAFLRDLSDEVGLRMVANGTTISITHPLVSLRESGEELPQFRYAKDRTDTVKTWKSTAGHLDPLGGRRTRREGYSFNTTTRALLRVVADGTQDATTTQYSTRRPFANQAEAQEILAAEVRKDTLWVHGEATVVGDCRLRPGTELAVAGGALGPKDAGVWMVRSATHRISVAPNRPAAGVYLTDVVLGRNRLDGLDSVPKAGRVDAIPDGAALIDGRWRAHHMGRA